MTQEQFTMTSKELSRYEIIKRLITKEINGTEVAKQISLSMRQIKRINTSIFAMNVIVKCHRVKALWSPKCILHYVGIIKEGAITTAPSL